MNGTGCQRQEYGFSFDAEWKNADNDAYTWCNDKHTKEHPMNNTTKKLAKNTVSCAVGAGAMRAVAARAAIPVLAPVVAGPLALPIVPMIAAGVIASTAASWVFDKIFGD